MIKQHFSRRRFLRWLGGLALTSAAAFGYGRYLEPRWVDVEQVTLALPRLPTAFVGKRIAQLSDLHLSQFFSPARAAEAFATINQLAPDWLFLTGDYVGDDARDAEGLIEPLRRLNMPVYASFGNHDYWSDIATVRKLLAATPVKILCNEAAQLGGDLWVAGVDDLWSGRPDLNLTMRNIPIGATTLLLAHEPDFFDRVVQQKAPVAVQFSGHTHGGQVRLPLTQVGTDGYYSYAPILPRYGKRYPIGLRRVGDQYVYTNRGLGGWPVPYRFNCRPEITLFTLATTS